MSTFENEILKKFMVESEDDGYYEPCENFIIIFSEDEAVSHRIGTTHAEDGVTATTYTIPYGDEISFKINEDASKFSVYRKI